MSRWLSLRTFALLAPLLAALPACGATWFVRPDGGTRFTQNRIASHLSGQCDGKADVAYPGSGVNRHCAFNDVRFLWGDATPNNNQKWVIAGGDTVIVRGSVQDGVSYRIGWPNKYGSIDRATGDNWGVPGDPYGSGPPPPPSGTEAAHTRILGGNYGNCRAPGARTQLHGGFGVNTVFRMDGASWVDLECIDITDFSPCGRASQRQSCNTNAGTLDDYAGSGITWSNTSTHDTLTDVNVHGIAGSGMLGPTGDGTVFRYLDIVGNAAAGWNADNNTGTTGTGSLLVQHFNISWNGCAEEYPLRDAQPYNDCTDDNAAGYGDGFGTATLPSRPGWTAVFDGGVVSYNTQDGLDALHLVGAGSSTTVTHTLAYGNMGQQIKVGGNQAILRDNIVYTNCNAMRGDVPGTPAGYNTRLSDFCRAADTGIFISVNDGTTSIFENNVVYSAASTMLQVGVNETCDTPTCRIRETGNIFVGFPKDRAHGYLGGTGELPNPVYIENAISAYLHPGSTFDHNTVYHARSSWHCPNTSMHETDAFCGNPHLKDETWHLYGYGDTSPTSATRQRTVTQPGAKQGKATVQRLGLFAVPCVALMVGLFTRTAEGRRRKKAARSNRF